VASLMPLLKAVCSTGVLCSRVCRSKKTIDQLLWWQNEPIMPHLSFQCLI
jgi:hypothetical protein